jgi:uncharacterized protein (DUF1778 family)
MSLRSFGLNCAYKWRTIYFFNETYDIIMTTATIKESRLNIRCDSRARELLDKAASYARVSVSEFVLTHALASAEQVVQAHEPIALKPKDFQAFLAALDAPAKPNAALKRAFKRHAEQVRR